MLRLNTIIKPWREAASLNDNINLYGFWNKTTFLTKNGDLGMVLGVPGVDYESLDSGSQEYAVKRLEASLKSFGPGFRVYQYMFKSNRPEIPLPKLRRPHCPDRGQPPARVLRSKARPPLPSRNRLLRFVRRCSIKERYLPGNWEVIH
jgi:hypothetical protein